MVNLLRLKDDNERDVEYEIAREPKTTQCKIKKQTK